MPPVQSVTSTPVARRHDRDNRMRTYAVAMSIRTVSFPLAVWAFMSGWIVVGWLLAAAAILLPSFAVMAANTVDERRIAATATPVQEQHGRLETTAEAGTDADAPWGGAVSEPLLLGPEDILRDSARRGAAGDHERS